MYCKNCGKNLNPNEKFCGNCGMAFESNSVNQNNQSQTMLNNNIQNQEMYNSQINNGISFESVNQNYNNNQVYQTNSSYINNCNNIKGNKKSLISLILGILSLVSEVFIADVIALPFSILGLILGIVDENKNKKKIIGIILNSCAIILSCIFLFTGIFNGILEGIREEKNYYGDGFSINYNYEWNEATSSDGKKALKYKSDKSYFMSIGKSALSEYYCDFNSITCQTSIYNQFYYFLIEKLNKESLSLYEGSKSFSILKDDIYYATYTFGDPNTDFEGKYYVLVSKEKNVILSFMTNTNTKNAIELHENVLKLLQNINIENNSNNKIDSSTNKINLTGGYKVINSETYWEFRNGEFWWYKSADDLNDNYWYGKTQILTGKEGVKLVGLNETKVDDIISLSNGKIKEENIYGIIFTPTKVIVNGQDKSSTNIPAGSTWSQVWILVDDLEEGIKAEVLDIGPISVDTFNCIKIKD